MLKFRYIVQDDTFRHVWLDRASILETKWTMICKLRRNNYLCREMRVAYRRDYIKLRNRLVI